MTKHNRYSRILHLATLCCFLLPFFYTGCGPSKAELEKREKVKQDSIRIADSTNATTIMADTIRQDSNLTASTKSADTIIQNSISQVDTSKEQLPSHQSDTTTSPKKEDESDNLSQKISNKFKFLKPLLIPESDTYTGIAIFINSAPYTPIFAIFTSFLFLIISFVVKFIDAGARKTIALLDILGLIFLSISLPAEFHSERLWGFWVAVIFASALLIYDLYMIKINKRQIE